MNGGYVFRNLERRDCKGIPLCWKEVTMMNKLPMLIFPSNVRIAWVNFPASFSLSLTPSLEDAYCIIFMMYWNSEYSTSSSLFSNLHNQFLLFEKPGHDVEPEFLIIAAQRHNFDAM